MEGEASKHETIDWEEMWEKGEMDGEWQISGKHELLFKHLEKMTGGKANARILAPFCGNDPEIKRILEAGHSVVGIELSRVAIESLFKDCSLEFTAQDVPGLEGQVFKSPDGKLTVFKGDLYKMNKEMVGECDAVWDRGGIEAVMTVHEKKKYAVVVINLLKAGGNMIISNFVFEDEGSHGHSHEGHDHEGQGHGHSHEGHGQEGHGHEGHGHGHEFGDDEGHNHESHTLSLDLVKDCYDEFATCSVLDQWDASGYVSNAYKITDVFYLVTKKT